jgi:hypothetical protein
MKWRNLLPAFCRLGVFLLLLILSSGRVNAFQSTACSGNQASNETVSGKDAYVASGQKFTVNINMTGLSPPQTADIQAGISSWAGTSGVQRSFGASAPGPGVITVSASTSIPSVGQGNFSSGGGSYAANQIASGTIQFNFGYTFACSTGTCLAYDPSAANADSYLTGLAAHEMGHVIGLDDTPDSASPCSQTSTSVMGGQCGTNNNGDGLSKPAPTSNAPTSCDKQNVTTQTSNKGIVPPAPPSSSGGGGGNGGGGGTGHKDGGSICYTYDEWDDGTNSLTNFTECVNTN